MKRTHRPRLVEQLHDALDALAEALADLEAALAALAAVLNRSSTQQKRNPR